MTIISEAAVEAALKDVFSTSELSRHVWESTIRSILEAAAPHMLAEAWDSALQDADDQGYLYDHQSELLKKHNPYRGQA